MLLQACPDASHSYAEPASDSNVADGDRFPGGTVWLKSIKADMVVGCRLIHVVDIQAHVTENCAINGFRLSAETIHMVKSIILRCKRLAALLAVISLCGCDPALQHFADLELSGDYKAISNCATKYFPRNSWLHEDHDDEKHVRFTYLPPQKMETIIDAVQSGAGRTHVSVTDWSIGGGSVDLYMSYFTHCASTISG